MNDNKKTILLVEDEVVLALTNKMLLEKYGYKVIIASTGEKALEHFKDNNDINLILMDIDLGNGIDGPETARIILKDRDIPVLFLSSHTEPEVVEKTEKITSFGYVVKNSSITVLDASIKMAFKLFYAYEKIRIELMMREQAEVEIMRYSSQITSMLNSIPDIIFFKDKNGFYLECNPAFAEFVGRSRDEIVGRTDLELFDKDTADFFREQDRLMLESKEPRHNEEKITYPDGREVLIDTLKTPCLGPNKEVLGVIGISRSFTLQNYEAFFNSINEFLFVLDEYGNMIHINDTVINRLGYKLNELIGKSVLMVHPAERREEAGRIVAEMLNGSSEFCPVPLITKSDIQIPVETRVSAGIWDGKPAIFGVSKDITRAKLSEEKFSKLFHLNPSACGVSDLDDHTYIEVNEMFYTLFGFERNEVIGKTAEDLGILTQEAINAVMSKADKNGNVTNVQIDLKTKTGAFRHVLMSSENFYVQDKRYRFTVVNDITDHKNVEQLRRENELAFYLQVSKER